MCNMNFHRSQCISQPPDDAKCHAVLCAAARHVLLLSFPADYPSAGSTLNLWPDPRAGTSPPELSYSLATASSAAFTI